MKKLAVKKGFVFPVKRLPHLRSKVSQEFLMHSIKDYHTVNCHNNFCNLHFFFSHANIWCLKLITNDHLLHYNQCRQFSCIRVYVCIIVVIYDNFLVFDRLSLSLLRNHLSVFTLKTLELSRSYLVAAANPWLEQRDKMEMRN